MIYECLADGIIKKCHSLLLSVYMFRMASSVLFSSQETNIPITVLYYTLRFCVKKQLNIPMNLV